MHIDAHPKMKYFMTLQEAMRAAKKIKEDLKTRRVKNLKGGVKKFFYQWGPHESGIDWYGLSEPNLTKIIERISYGIELGYDPKDYKRDFETIEILQKAVLQYIEFLEAKKDGSPAQLKKAIPSPYPFEEDEIFWIIYHFDYSSDSGGHVYIGRGILSVSRTGNDLDGKTAFFKGANESSEQSFTGDFELWNGRFGIFDLKGTGLGKRLNMTFNMGRKPSELALGMYVTPFLKNSTTIVSGTMILEKVSKERALSIRPALLSYLNKEEFEDIPLVIRRFFSLKNQNYLRAFSMVYSKEALGRKIAAYKPTATTYFVSEVTPIAFFSSSVNDRKAASTESSIKWISQYVAGRFPETLTVLYPEGESKERRDHLSTDSNLDTIRRATYFVLIYTGDESDMNSIVEMSWALTSSKVVIICYKKDKLPLNVLELELSSKFGHLVFVQFDDFDSDKESIAERIANNIAFYKKKNPPMGDNLS